MNKTLRTILLCFIGTSSIALGIYCFSFNTGEFIMDHMYGGDAFTGMQNASATAARNLLSMSKIIQFGLSSLLIVGGAMIVVLGIPKKKDKVANSTEQAK
jgi:hypothetical protein